MELKARLQDYTKAEFTNLVHLIWNSELPKNDLDILVNHFNDIVEHPDGTDLIFYPPFVEYGYAEDADSVVYWLNAWLQQNNKSGFKGEPPFAGFSAQRSIEGRSAAALAMAEQMASIVQGAEQKIEHALQSFADPLSKIETLVSFTGSAPEQLPEQRLSGLIENISLLQAAEPPLRNALSLFNVQGRSLDSSISRAQRDLESTRPFIDRTVQSGIVQKLTQVRSKYLAKLPGVQERSEHLLSRAAVALVSGQEQRIRLGSLLNQGPNDISHTLITTTRTANRPDVLIEHTANQLQSDLVSLQFAVRSAIAKFSWERETSTEGIVGQYIDLLHFSTQLRGDERYGLTLPLSEITPLNVRDWNLDAETGDLELPFRLSARIQLMEKDPREYQHIYMTPTDGINCPSNVRVRAATFDPDLRTYRFTSDGLAPTTILWKSTQTPANLREGPAESTGVSYNSGGATSGYLPTPKPLPDDIQFNDYIIVFPKNSGIEPVYLMLKDYRDYPGVGTGEGQIISGVWLPGASPSDGATVPSQIAEQLRGRIFKNFGGFNEAFWTAVAADSVLAAQFSAEDRALMLRGDAPSIMHDGIRKLCRLHHLQSAARGGKLYDVDNIRITFRA